MVLVFVTTVKPNGLKMKIQNTVQENQSTSVECKSNSANPSSSVDMHFFIDSTRQNNIIPEVTETHSSDNGMVKTFVFTFTSDRNQNGMIVRCPPDVEWELY